MKVSIHCICLLLVVKLMACGSGSAERDKTAKPTRELSANGYITGVVKEIQLGKDGYTAKIHVDTIDYFAIISHANLNNPAQYRTVKIGDTITVKGDQTKIGNEEHIAVTELK